MQISNAHVDHQRIAWVDVLRFIAIFMVIAIHCSDPFNVSAEARSNPDFNYWGSIYGSALRACVPIFVMITGLLLLPVKMSMGEFYKKRLLRITVPFLLWSVLYNLFPWITGLLGLPPTIISNVFAYAAKDSSQSLASALVQISLIPIKFNVYTVPMWYIYMLIGLYLYMPFFSAWVEKSTSGQQKVFLGIWLCTLVLPYAYSFFSKELFGLSAWNTFGTFYYFTGFNGFLLLGYVLTHHLKTWSFPKTFLVSVPLFIIGYTITYTGFKWMASNPAASEEQIELFFLYCSPQVFMMTLAIFLLVRTVKLTSVKMRSIFSNITKCGFGIYLVHYFVVGLGYWLANVLSIPISLKIPMTAALVFLISWGFVATFYKIIPRASKWIFG
ncbi:acyl-transferase [Sphingobacterium sp. B29]|uniref:acyltransferase n=1 Tax=Sphingobacterium sp. B29 TaxID=1933220 RepID=UPI0009580E18|nr:acyltransferase family protein [Sphingobacterium sp. B29]APU98620.1 acyl-transferase [Sphingobacterium sp. B29]